MGCRTSSKQVYHMECDICGKKEEIEVDYDPFRDIWRPIKHWSTFEFKHYVPTHKNTILGVLDSYAERRKRISLCPECSEKFKKLIKNVKWE